MTTARFTSRVLGSLGLALFGMSTPGNADPISWHSLQISALDSGSSFFGVTVANLPDGRFVLGQQGRLLVQSDWGDAASIQVTGGYSFDPSFVVVRDANSALVGGGGFSASGLHPFNPAIPTSGIAAAIATIQNYTAAYWHSPTTSLEGWLIGGSNGSDSKHNVTFVSLDGAVIRTVTGDLCSFSSGIAVDGNANLYTALYELAGTADETDADKVLRFSAAQVESAVQSGTPVPRSAAVFLHKFDGASTIGVDSLGRVWAGRFTSPDVQVYDPATGGQRTLVPVHDPVDGDGPDIYQPACFTRDSVARVGFLVYDSWQKGGTPVYFVHAQATEITVPNTLATWSAFRFGAENITPGTEAALWGANADPDHDGLSNLTEYAFNLLPLVSDGSGAVTSSTGGGLFAISFLRDPLNTDLTYAVEVSDTLAANDWTVIASSAGGSGTTASPSGGAAVSESAEGSMQRVVVSVGASAASRRFARLRLTLSTP